MKLLIVEDNKLLLDSLKTILETEYTVDTADNGEDGMFFAEQNIYDLIILDVMLPYVNGFDIVKQIRQEKIKTPVLFLTAKDALEDRVKGLEYGGDDYLVKPFQTPELQARIKALLRRSGSLDLDEGIKYKGIVLTGKENDVLINEVPIKLTIKQYDLLEYLIQNNGKIVTKEQIFDRIWGFDSDTTIAIVEVFIHQIRKKLEPFDFHKDIQTVRGVGYILKDY
ncbi:MAG: response regulator transcription factor [Bacillus sp. (in: Bacteria)]|uniref:response regulator transcription factor n=1 Tax=Niallia sp. FSL W8-1348 TaxID=2954656 RepID=UPI000332990E|nr:response regulator [Niallia nealsonii AAU1]MBQ6447749.1 response regulator transcription factor [Bacillus sp. (in: firmicutes)]MDU1846083.1 response regulator transcription factor [Niallia nealsonii]